MARINPAKPARAARSRAINDAERELESSRGDGSGPMREGDCAAGQPVAVGHLLVHIVAMRRTKLALILSAVIGAGILPYALRAEPVRRVGEHEFRVPAERLFDAQIFWLPKPDPGAFSFILDFPADPKLIPPHIVLVQSKGAVCRAGQAQMIRIACGSENSELEPAPPYAKVFPIKDYPFAWDYYSPREAGGSDKTAQLQVAYCTPISPNPARPNGTAIYTTVWALGDMILSLGFEESGLKALPAMRDRATAMLASWEVR